MNTFRRSFTAITAAGAFAMVTGITSPAIAKDDSETTAIQESLKLYEQALNRADTAAIVRLYTADGVQMAPDAAAVVGGDAVGSAYDATFKAVSLNLAFKVDEIKLLNKETALLRSHSSGTLKVHGSAQPPNSVAFKELFVLRKQTSGQWKFSHYSFSSSPVNP